MTVVRTTLHTVWTEKRECCCMCFDTIAQTETDTAAQTKTDTVVQTKQYHSRNHNS